jgi:hypothetical protein
MQITIDLPDNLSLTELDLRIEFAIVLFQQKILLPPVILTIRQMNLFVPI